MSVNIWDEEEEIDNFSDYGSAEYWDQRYKENKKPFDWYFGWKRLSSHIKDFIRPTDSVLVIGCGNSEMSFDMLETGFSRVVSVDISESVIAQMREKYRNESRLEWFVSDCTKMEQFENESFDLIIDKGTIDAMMCNLSSNELVRGTMTEVWRLLKKNGRFIMVSFGSPSQRLPVMRSVKRHWFVYPPMVLAPEPDRKAEEGTKNYVYVLEKH